MKQIDNLFWKRLEKIYSSSQLEIIKKGFNIKKRKVSFRINTLKSNSQEILKVLSENNINYTKIPFLENSFIVDVMEKDLWNLDIFKDGKIYLQSISSQIPALFLDLKPNQKILDATASPGSKTSQMASILQNTGEIIANDNNAIRIEKLKFTLERQGVLNTKVIKNDARNLSKMFSSQTFDVILADLPCSAEGRINFNNEKSFGFWSEENISKNALLQKEILKDIVGLLKNGGILVYSTCTLSVEENEEIVDFLLENFSLELQEVSLDYENIVPGITSFGDKKYNSQIKKTIRCLPSELTEGFYIAKFKKI